MRWKVLTIAAVAPVKLGAMSFRDAEIKPVLRRVGKSCLRL